MAEQARITGLVSDEHFTASIATHAMLVQLGLAIRYHD